MVAPTIGYKGEELNLLVRQGATFGPVNGTLTNPDTSPVDLTGCTLRGQIRRTPSSTGVSAPLDFTITNAALGQFYFKVSAANTTLLAAGDTETDPDSVYTWDMEMQDTAGSVLPMAWGAVNVFREVTK